VCLGDVCEGIGESESFMFGHVILGFEGVAGGGGWGDCSVKSVGEKILY
jgi:hypothetical protein